MRIVGGQYKGRTLVAPKGMATRPTTDRTRESVFNILSHRDGWSFEGSHAIDLFAGSGALGFEAVSRGAAFCLFVDSAAAARGAIRENQEALGLTGSTRIHRRSATRLGTRPSGMEEFSIAFLDPPYREGLVEPALLSLSEGAWLAPAALCVVEQARGETLTLPPNFNLLDERAFGDTLVRFLEVG
ncbi:MAG: 16S rRNA (guanine(966)-N(2))-methyltransferase RsmD [Parvularcula sp.]